MTRKPYDSDLTDKQWDMIEPMLPPAKHRGRPRADLREVVNAVMYVARAAHGACSRATCRRGRPSTRRFKRWTRDGTLEKIHDALRSKVRESEGRDASPSAAIIDSQSVKTTQKRGSADTTRAKK